VKRFSVVDDAHDLPGWTGLNAGDSRQGVGAGFRGPPGAPCIDFNRAWI
jgi:hypothetical protein